MTHQLDLNAPIVTEIGRLTLRAVTAETMLAHARERISELEAQIAEKKQGQKSRQKAGAKR